MKLPALVALVLAALLAALFWIKSGSESEQGPAMPEERDAGAQREIVEPELDVLAGGEGRTAVLDVSEVEPKADASAGAARIEELLPAWIELNVLDEADGTPLAGASVFVDEASASGAGLRSFGGAEQPFGELGVTDVEGRFLLESLLYASHWMRVEAQGYGEVLLQLPAERAADDPPLVVRARRTAALVGRVESSAGGTVRVWLSSSMYRLLSDASAQSFIGGELRLGAKSDELGWFELSELPARVPFVVELVSEGRPTRRLSEPLVLEPGERREVSWKLDASADVEVLALDTRGYPAAGVELRLIRADEVFGGLVQVYTDAVSTTVTDGGGLARFERVAQGDWVVAPQSVEGTGGRSARAEGYAPEATRFTVGAQDDRVELELALHFGQTISGLVLAPDGSPAPLARVSIQQGARRIFIFERADEEGRFKSGVLVSGIYSVAAEPGSKTPGASRSAPLEAELGASDLIVNLRPSAPLVVELRDAVSGDLRPGQLILNELDTKRIYMPDTSGVKEFDNLPPGEYELAGLAQNGSVGLVGRFTLTAGSDPREIVVPLAPGGRVRVAYRGPHDVMQLRVLAGDQIVSLDGLERGLQKTLAAPAGRVTVRGTVYLDERDPSGEVLKIVQERDVDVPAGGIVDVVFE